MTDKIVRANSTVVSGIKTCTFKEQVNTEENLRFGACSSSSIEFEVFGSQANAIPVGEELTYYQTDENGVDTLIGVFTAQPSIPSRNTYKVVAYDNIIKLETDFSEHLASIQSSFPMTLSALLAEVATVAGVTFGNSPTLASTVIQEFSANGVSCRQVVAWAAEMSGQYVHCDTNGDILFGWYAARSGYSVRPGSGSGGGVTYVPYREGGLNYKDYAVSAVDRVAVKPPEEEDVAYIYPTSATGNTYVVSNNLLLTNADSAVMNTVAQTLYGVLSAMPTYRPVSISLFRFDNPFRAGDVVSVTDVQGVSFNTLVMSMTVSLDGASVECTGKETYDSDSGGGVPQQLVNLANNIVRINKLKVDWADIDTAIINYLTANNVTAQNLTIVDEYGNVLATFDGSGIVLGETAGNHAEIDFNSFELIDQDGNAYLSVGDLRDENGEAQVSARFVGDGTTQGFILSPTAAITSPIDVTVNGTPITSGVMKLPTLISFSTPPTDGAVIVASYKTEAPSYHYDFGARQSGTSIGWGSVASGNQPAAEGVCSAVGGGANNSALGNYSVIAGGRNNSTNDSGDAVLGGTNNEASGGNSSVVGGTGNKASGENQTVFGRYNAEDAADTYVEIVGNGSADNDRQNARTLDWSGNETLAGMLYVNGSDQVATQANVPTKVSDLTNDIGAMEYLGANVITDSANDTAVNWIGFGTGYAMFSTTGALMNKPSSYGMVLSWVNANNVTQLWITVGGSNSVWKRSGDNANGNTGGWYGGGWAQLAEANAVLPVQSSPETITFSGYRAVAQGYASTSTNANVFMPMPNNASGAAVVRTGTWTLGTPSQASAAVSGLAVTQVTRAGIYMAVTSTGLTTGEPVTLKCTTNATMTITWS